MHPTVTNTKTSFWRASWDQVAWTLRVYDVVRIQNRKNKKQKSDPSRHSIWLGYLRSNHSFNREDETETESNHSLSNCDKSDSDRLSRCFSCFSFYNFGVWSVWKFVSSPTHFSRQLLSIKKNDLKLRSIVFL